jgi:hypothetical protein
LFVCLLFFKKFVCFPEIFGAGSHSAGHILSLFVDFLPQRQTQFFLNILVQRLAHDKSSTETRAAVLRALNRVCGAQHITHVILKGMQGAENGSE